MTESTTGTTPPDAGNTDPTPTPEDTEATATATEYKVKVPEGNKGSGRFAVYDKVLERYVGEVVDSKPSSTDARKLAGGHSYAIVEV